MNQELIHVYLMPGLAASSAIFNGIDLDSETFEIHKLEWFIPELEESLESYAKRMAAKVVHDNAVLLGVSFGGILVQEMSKFLSLRKLIIVSSVKSRRELPRRMKLARRTKAYRIIPTRLTRHIDNLAKYAFGKTIDKRIELYRTYLSMNDARYLDWAIKNAICWNREEVDDAVIHIHGDKDAVFPIRNIKPTHVIKGGTHIMIINRFKWFNENLPGLILS